MIHPLLFLLASASAQPVLEPATTVAPGATMPVPATPFIRPAEIDNSLEVTGESIEAKEVRTRMAVDVSVNGKGPYRFFVDSGADRTVIGSELAARLALPEGRRVLLHSMGGAHAVTTVKVDKLLIGDSEIEDIAAPALPENFLGAQGLLGIDALADQRMTMDFDAKRITIQDTRKHAPAIEDGEEIVVVARRRKGQLILTQASAGHLPLSAVIDSGAEVTIGNRALRQRLVGRSKQPLEQTTLLSVTGESIPAEIIVLRELKIGGVKMYGVPVAFTEVPPFALFGLSREPAILLGTDLLQGFRRVSLDFRNRKVRFLLRREG